MTVKCINQCWWGLRNQLMILKMNEGKKLLISILPSLCELFHGVTKWWMREICLYRNTPADKERMIAWEKSSFCNPQWTDGSGHRLSAAVASITKRETTKHYVSLDEEHNTIYEVFLPSGVPTHPPPKSQGSRSYCPFSRNTGFREMCSMKS